MNTIDSSLPAAMALSERFMVDYPYEAARALEALPHDDAAAILAVLPARAAVCAWQSLPSVVALEVLRKLPESAASDLLAQAEPTSSADVLSQMGSADRDHLLGRLSPEIARELREMLDYPADSAGRLRDPRVSPLVAGMTVPEALARLRRVERSGLRELFVIDPDGRLTGRVEIQDLATAAPETPLSDLTRDVVVAVRELDPREAVIDALQRFPVSELPVIDQAGRFRGVIRQARLLAAVEEDASLDLLTMVGAGREERALSGPLLALRLRLPWLQINLLTAFLAASVVGLFEGIVAKFTALAVLLPVVAGQSGNSGSQALAVTMRGLVLREITIRHWRPILGKEAIAGFLNGAAVALTAGLGVYVWNQSIGLVVVIALAMVISMTAAGMAGALVPILLRRFGQDPATAASIILTTVTDVVGFFSFLGIAVLLAPLLE